MFRHRKMKEGKSKKRWFTCTPVSFRADHTFYFRDSGLFSKAFEEAGCESQSIMPLPHHKGDWPEVLRPEYKNLEDPDWWKSLNLDGVLFYSWGAPKYEKIAKAIHESGTKCLIYLDTSKGFYPFYNWLNSTKQMWKLADNPFGFMGRFAKMNLLSPIFVEIKRKRHLSYADLVFCPMPDLFNTFKKQSWFYGDLLKKKVELLCCPIASHFKYEGEEKEESVIAVGRWDDIKVKRPDFLRKGLSLLLSKNRRVKCYIIGTGFKEMNEWKAKLPPQDAVRVVIIENVRNFELADLYKKTLICLCSSVREGTHNVSAEALCCGCSIVAPDNPGLMVHKWYASEESGRIAKDDTPEAFAEAIEEEINNWNQGKRDPYKISGIWTKRVHAVESVKRILKWDETGIMPGFESDGR